MAEEQKNCKPSDCAGCAHADSCSSKPQDFKKPANPHSHVNKVIAVVSGKGGVGKSMVTASLARMMKEQGFSVGTKIMSVNLLLPNESDPVIWRGPVIANVVTQFWTDVMWGELDYLFVDMPPGTGDVPLTVFQSLPVDGVVIVTSPQDLVQMIVSKAYNMARQMDIPVLGIVENYSYLKCPDCGKEIKVFGESHVDETAEKFRIPVLGKMPIDPALAEMVEEERFYEASNEYLAAAVNKL